MRAELPHPTTTAEFPRPLVDLLVELVRCLEQQAGSPPAAGSGGTLERWDDEDFIYLEVELAEPYGLEIDLNAHEGRAYIRVERQDVETPRRSGDHAEQRVRRRRGSPRTP